MLPWYLVLIGVAFGAALIAVSYWPRAEPLREAVVPSRIGELEPGRFRIVGRVVPIRVVKSEIDDARCVYVERAHYARTGNSFASMLREVDHDWSAAAFFVDDGTGRVVVDPTETLIDCETVADDEGLVAERRLREGEEVEVVATIRPADPERHGAQGPYPTPPFRFEPDRAEMAPSVKRIDAPRALARSLGSVVIGVTLLSSLVPDAPPRSAERIALEATPDPSLP
mgnify:CR=1 FL=1